MQILLNHQLDLINRNGVLLFERTDFLANSVYNKATQTIRAHQGVVVHSFKASFSDGIPRFQFGIRGFDLFRTYFTDVANRAGEQIAVRVTTAVNHEHFDYGNVGAMRFYVGNVGGARFRLDNDGLEFRHGLGRIDLLLQFVQRHAQAVGDLREQPLHLPGSVAQEQHAEGRI